LFGHYKNSAILVTRLIQVLSLCLIITGFLWASSDVLLITVLEDSSVTPMSVLFMLYGFVGSVITELMARWIAKSDSSQEKKPGGGA